MQNSKLVHKQKTTVWMSGVYFLPASFGRLFHTLKRWHLPNIITLSLTPQRPPCMHLWTSGVLVKKQKTKKNSSIWCPGNERCLTFHTKPQVVDNQRKLVSSVSDHRCLEIFGAIPPFNCLCGPTSRWTHTVRLSSMLPAKNRCLFPPVALSK